MLIHYRALFFFLTLTGLMLMLVLGCFSQTPKTKHVKTSSIDFSGTKNSIVDLTKNVEAECTESIRREVNGGSVIVKFQPAAKSEAEKIAEALANVLRDMAEYLHPLKVGNIRVSLIQMDNPPTNYKISERVANEQTYVTVLPFKDRNELVLDDSADNKLAVKIYSTTPHEMTHKALDELITRHKTRWFDDGLAEYIGFSILKKYCPKLFQSGVEEFAPTVMLYRPDIRRNILSWNETGLGIIKKSQRELVKQFYYYLASYELIRQIVAESRKRGIETPLQTILARLMDNRRESKKPTDTDKLLNLIRENLKVDPETLGDIDPDVRQRLVAQSISILGNADTKTEDRVRPLYILAGIGDIPVPENTASYLLETAFNRQSDNDELANLASESILIRFQGRQLDELLRRYVAPRPELKEKSIKVLKQKLKHPDVR